METTLHEVQKFIEDYKVFLKVHEQQKFTHFKQDFESLLTEHNLVQEKIKVREREEANKYNIFDVLNVKFAETLSHTPFLKNLLDPEGTHGQRTLFLKLFLQKFIPEDKRECFELSEEHNYNVTEEKVMSRGRIDIYIHSLDIDKKFAIVIENKIYAADQYNQLKRYYNFLKEGLGFNNKQIMMFYLTPKGKIPDQTSIDRFLGEKLVEDQVLKILSYREHVVKWLDESLKLIQAKKIKIIVDQYLKTIKSL